MSQTLTPTTVGPHREDRLWHLRLASATAPSVFAPRISVVMPVLNEAANLPHVLARMPPIYELIVVDGNSSDGTPDVASSLWPSARIIAQPGRGKGDALRAGFAVADGDIIVMLDADGSTDPAEIPRFVGALLEGADYVKGSRFLPGAGSADITPLRRVGAQFLTRLVNAAFHTHYTDLCYGYNAFWRDCVKHIPITSDGFEVETLLNIKVARAKLAVAEVPSMEQLRLNGESHLHVVRDGLRVLRTIVRERTRRRPAIAVEGLARSAVPVNAS
jgi:glycosyltransferase involved in cell wall biosynthesis